LKDNKGHFISDFSMNKVSKPLSRHKNAFRNFTVCLLYFKRFCFVAYIHLEVNVTRYADIEELKNPFRIRTGSIFPLEKLHMIEMVGVNTSRIVHWGLGGGRIFEIRESIFRILDIECEYPGLSKLRKRPDLFRRKFG
jgi:hypothetical protein